MPERPRKERLIVIAPTPPPTHGGTVFSAHLLRALRSIGLLAAHLDTRDPRPRSTLGRLDLENVRLALKHAGQLVGLLRNQPGASVYVPISQGRWGFLRDTVFIALARLWRRRVYLHLHGGHFHLFYRESGPLVRTLIRWVSSVAHQAWVLTPSLRICFEGLVSPDRVRVLENVVDDPLGDATGGVPAGTDLHRDDQLSTDRNGLRILYLSNVQPTKGCFDLLDAVEQMDGETRDWHLRFVGEAESAVEAELRRRGALMERSGVRVEVLGTRTGNAKLDALHWADVFAFPTRYPLEGQPLVILEALGAGLPIVATRHAGIPETARDGTEAVLVEPGNTMQLADALRRLAGDPGLRAQLSRAARSRYEKRYRPERLERDFRRLLYGA